MYLTYDMLQPQTLTQDLYDLALLEGDLLAVRAQQRLGTGDDRQDDEPMTDNESAVYTVFRTLAWLTIVGQRFTHPACASLLRDIHQSGRETDPFVRDYAWKNECHNARCDVAMAERDLA